MQRFYLHTTLNSDIVPSEHIRIGFCDILYLSQVLYPDSLIEASKYVRDKDFAVVVIGGMMVSVYPVKSIHSIHVV